MSKLTDADDGKLWSLLRSVLSQGVDIYLDNAGRERYELYSARLDAAASERVEQLRAALSERSPAERDGWQPIETAPKTGRKIIVFYLNRNNKPRRVMARWLTDEQAAETDADGVGLEGGWYECIDNWDDYAEVAIHEGEPSHWRELPAAPSAEQAGGA